MLELDRKESSVPKKWCFWTVVLEKTPVIPLDTRRSNKSILMEISVKYSLEGLMLKLKLQSFSSVQLLSRVWLFMTPWTAACQASLSISNSWTHVHQVSDAIQPSHPLLSPSPPAPNPSQHQGLFQWVNSSHEVAKVLEFQLQHQSFQWTPRTDLL